MSVGDQGFEKEPMAIRFKGADDVDREAIHGTVESKVVVKLWAKEICSEAKKKMTPPETKPG